MLEDDEMVFNVNFLIKIGDYIKLRKSIKEFKKSMKEKLNGHVSIYPAFRSKSRLGINIAVLILYVKLLFHYNKKIIVHGRGTFSALIAAKLKSIRRNVSFIYDVRADSSAEFRFNAEKQGLPEKVIEDFVNDQNKIQRYLTRRAAHIFCVSSILKGRLIEITKTAESKITILPCLADNRKFYFDKERRANLRKDLGLEDKFVFIYTGGTGAWHYTDEVYRIIGSLLHKHENTFFVILTPDTDAAADLAKTILPEGRYIIKNAKQDEVSDYMLASDMGILLRERHPLNEVASPTKFAEYVMSGLPVLISEGIGDYSPFVAQHKLGIILNNDETDEEITKMVAPYHTMNGSLDKEKIARLGAENFSKQKYIDLMKGIYKII
jgi:glycosyltransferase involved in cell wall biosynthesis